MGTPAAGSGHRPQCFPLSKSKSFHPTFIKLGEYVSGHNISTKFYYQPNPLGTPLLNYGPWIVPHCPKLGFLLCKSNSFHLTFIKLGEYVGGHNISIKFYKLPNPQGLLNFAPWIVQKLNKRYLLSQVEYPAPKTVVITIEFTTNMTCVFCVSLALLLHFLKLQCK